MAPERLLKAEQDHHRKAFELYYEQGERRTHKRVARDLGVSTSTIKLWSRSFDWRGRIAERDAETARRVADRVLETRVGERARNTRIVHMALVKLAKGIAEDRVRMQMGDLDRLIRLQDELDPTARERESLYHSEGLAEFLDMLLETRPEMLKRALALVANKRQKEG